MLVLEKDGAVLLEKRPAPGIWGGLWCLPEIGAEEDPLSAAVRLGLSADDVETLRPEKHAFTHFHLTITPARLKIGAATAAVAEPGRRWWLLEEARRAGLPAPVRRILERLSA
jgi:A/G-specific adenine glycosylase